MIVSLAALGAVVLTQEPDGPFVVGVVVAASSHDGTSERAKESLLAVRVAADLVEIYAGEHLVFSMMLNNYPDAGALRRDSIDAIAVLLASFAGKSQ